VPFTERSTETSAWEAIANLRHSTMTGHLRTPQLGDLPVLLFPLADPAKQPVWRRDQQGCRSVTGGKDHPGDLPCPVLYTICAVKGVPRPRRPKPASQNRKDHTMTSPDQKTIDRVTTLISEITDIPKTDLQPGKRLAADLEIDSLTTIELAVAIQDEFNIDVEDEKLKQLKTIQDITDLIHTNHLTTSP
jgi:acyl carrier protein